jgi:hypothetical protein
MKNLTATICLTLAVLLGSAGVSWSGNNCGLPPGWFCDEKESRGEKFIRELLSPKSKSLKPAANGIESQVEYIIGQSEWGKKPLGYLASSQEMCNLLRHPMFQRPLDQFGLLGSVNMTPHWSTTELSSQWIQSRLKKFGIQPNPSSQWRPFSEITKIANIRLSSCLERLSSTSPRTYSILAKYFLQYLSTKRPCFEKIYRIENIIGDDGIIKKEKVLDQRRKRQGCVNFSYDGANYRRWGSTTFVAMLTLKEAHSALRTILDHGELELSQKVSSHRLEKEREAEEEVRRAELEREAQETAEKEAKKPKNPLKELKNSYTQYMMVRECHKTNVMYIGYSQMESAKFTIKRVEEYYKSKGKNINTNDVWKISAKEFDENMGVTFSILQMVGDYDPKISVVCRLNLMGLTSFQVPGAEKEIRKKDF